MSGLVDRAQYRDQFHGKGNQQTTHQSNRGRITLACIARKSLEICGRCRLVAAEFPAASKSSLPRRRHADTLPQHLSEAAVCHGREPDRYL